MLLLDWALLNADKIGDRHALIIADGRVRQRAVSRVPGLQSAWLARSEVRFGGMKAPSTV